ncbi:MAG TPA: endoribonuclease MazF [Terriglobales bacterium]|nr:endoribonuclease MazF [Terriglobales bacterium]
MTAYVPEYGDIVWIDFDDPPVGHEQSGRRPALVMSPSQYNRTIGLALICPITSRVKKYPFEVAVESGKIKGVVLADHIKSLDWRVRRARLAGKAQAAITETVRKRLARILLIS